jgi:hypothetical protein
MVAMVAAAAAAVATATRWTPASTAMGTAAAITVPTGPTTDAVWQVEAEHLP